MNNFTKRVLADIAAQARLAAIAAREGRFEVAFAGLTKALEIVDLATVSPLIDKQFLTSAVHAPFDRCRVMLRNFRLEAQQ